MAPDATPKRPAQPEQAPRRRRFNPFLQGQTTLPARRLRVERRVVILVMVALILAAVGAILGANLFTRPRRVRSAVRADLRPVTHLFDASLSCLSGGQTSALDQQVAARALSLASWPTRISDCRAQTVRLLAETRALQVAAVTAPDRVTGAVRRAYDNLEDEAAAFQLAVTALADDALAGHRLPPASLLHQLAETAFRFDHALRRTAQAAGISARAPRLTPPAPRPRATAPLGVPATLAARLPVSPPYRIEALPTGSATALVISGRPRPTQSAPPRGAQRPKAPAKKGGPGASQGVGPRPTLSTVTKPAGTAKPPAGTRGEQLERLLLWRPAGDASLLTWHRPATLPSGPTSWLDLTVEPSPRPPLSRAPDPGLARDRRPKQAHQPPTATATITLGWRPLSGRLPSPLPRLFWAQPGFDQRRRQARVWLASATTPASPKSVQVPTWRGLVPWPRAGAAAGSRRLVVLARPRGLATELSVMGSVDGGRSWSAPALLSNRAAADLSSLQLFVQRHASPILGYPLAQGGFAVQRLAWPKGPKMKTSASFRLPLPRLAAPPSLCATDRRTLFLSAGDSDLWVSTSAGAHFRRLPLPPPFAVGQGPGSLACLSGRAALARATAHGRMHYLTCSPTGCTRPRSLSWSRLHSVQVLAAKSQILIFAAAARGLYLRRDRQAAGSPSALEVVMPWKAPPAAWTAVRDAARDRLAIILLDGRLRRLLAKGDARRWRGG